MTIKVPFKSFDEFRQKAGEKLSLLISLLMREYTQLEKRCGMMRMLAAVRLGWGLSNEAAEENYSLFDGIDRMLMPAQYGGVSLCPDKLMVDGVPFVVAEGEEQIVHFVWDVFAILIDNYGVDNVKQTFFDFADKRQTKAYRVMVLVTPAPSISQSPPAAPSISPKGERRSEPVATPALTSSPIGGTEGGSLFRSYFDEVIATGDENLIMRSELCLSRAMIKSAGISSPTLDRLAEARKQLSENIKMVTNINAPIDTMVGNISK